MNSQQELEKWIVTLPASTQRLVREFPPGSSFNVNGQTMWVMSYGEDDDVVRLSPVDPFEDYEGAMEARVPCCASHLR